MQGRYLRIGPISVFPLACLLVCLSFIYGLVLTSPAQTHADTTTATIVTHQVTGPQVPVGQKGTLTVSCDTGEQLLSGGFSGYAFEGAVYVVESYPSASDTWTVTVDNTSAPSSVQITASVYCLQANYSLASTIVHASSSGSGMTVANCPAGSTLLSGGYAGTIRPTTSSPVTNGWQSDEANVYAVCATQNAGAVSIASATFTTPSNSTSSGAMATCSVEQLATGGGFSGVAAGGGTPIISSQETSTGWSVAVEGSQYSQATVTVWAVCLSSSASNPTPTPTPVPPSPVHVTYRVDGQWTGGFTVDLQLTNNGATALNGWTLQFTFPGDQQITQLWNGSWSQSGAQVTITNLSYNQTIAPGQSLYLGFNGSWNSNNPSPTSFTLNGAPTS